MLAPELAILAALAVPSAGAVAIALAGRKPNLREAVTLLDKSKFLRGALGDEVVDHYVHTGNWEQFEYDRRVTDWERRRGFEQY